MALPESVSVGTIQALCLVGSAGIPDSGTLIFRPGVASIAAGGALIDLETTTAVLDAEGRAEVVLVATDDPDTYPTGFTYRVQLELASGTQHVLITVPAGATSTLDDVIVLTDPSTGGLVAQGPAGLSAYQLAVQQNGFTGSLSEWLASLVGPAGQDGVANVQPVAELPAAGTEDPNVLYLVVPE